MNTVSLKLTYIALFVLALGTFVSVSFSAVSHILFIIPALYFFVQDFVKKEKPIKISLSSIFLLMMMASMILSVVANLDILERPFKNILKIKYFLIPWLSVFAVQRLVDNYLDEKKKKVLIYTFLLATSVATISGIIALYTGFNPIKMKNACHPVRACGLFGMYMTYGYGISLFAVLLTIAAIKKMNVVRPWTIYISTLLGIAGTVLSFARGGWIGYAAGVMGYFFKKNIKLCLTFFLVALLSFGGAITFSSKVKDMFLSRGQSNSQRIAFYETAYVAFKEKPVFGWGYRNFESNVKEIKKKYKIAYPEFGGHAHNNLLEHLASTGIVGFLATLGFFLAWLIESFRRKDIIGDLTFPFVLSFITSGMFQYTFGDGENLFLIMGVWTLSQLRGQDVENN